MNLVHSKVRIPDSQVIKYLSINSGESEIHPAVKCSLLLISNLFFYYSHKVKSEYNQEQNAKATDFI